MSLNVGEKVWNNRYTILRRVGGGGMGEMYLALDSITGAQVAIKSPKSEFDSEENSLNRQRTEAKHVAVLVHKNIAKLVDYFEADGHGYLVTEFIDGDTLSEVYKSAEHQLPIKHILDILAQIAQGLQAAHNAGIVHRDIKPSNILITKDGVVKIIDFGISKSARNPGLTIEGTVVGTALYISPEQAKGENATAKSDIYSLGIIAFELSQGYRPFSGPNDTAVALNHVRQSVPIMARPPSMDFEKYVRKMLEKDPELRPKDANDAAEFFAGEKQKIQDEDPSKALPVFAPGADQADNPALPTHPEPVIPEPQSSPSPKPSLAISRSQKIVSRPVFSEPVISKHIPLVIDPEADSSDPEDSPPSFRPKVVNFRKQYIKPAKEPEPQVRAQSAPIPKAKAKRAPIFKDTNYRIMMAILILVLALTIAVLGIMAYSVISSAPNVKYYLVDLLLKGI